MEKDELLGVEEKAIDAMLEQGVHFDVKTGGVMRLLGVKRYRLHLKQPFLGTLLYISKDFLKVKFDEAKLAANPFSESFTAVSENAIHVARVVAVALLNSKWKIRLFRRVLARWLMWKLTPQELFNFMVSVITISNTASFINSIRLMGIVRVSEPKKNENLSRDNAGV